MTQYDEKPHKLKQTVKVAEGLIIKVLIGFMTILLILATIELGYTLFHALTIRSDDHLLLNLNDLLNVFGVFLLVLIGIELLDTIKVYLRKHVIHVEVVMLVAIIAISRKIIVMDYDKYSGIEMLGIAGIIVALAGGYFLIKKTGGCGFWPKETDEFEDIEINERINNENEGVIERKKIIRRRSEQNLVPPPGELSLSIDQQDKKQPRSALEKNDD